MPRATCHVSCSLCHVPRVPRANALAAAGRRREALAAVAEAEALDGAMAGKPFAAALARLRKALGGDEGQGEGQEEAGRGEGMPAAAGAGAKA